MLGKGHIATVGRALNGHSWLREALRGADGEGRMSLGGVRREMARLCVKLDDKVADEVADEGG